MADPWASLGDGATKRRLKQIINNSFACLTNEQISFLCYFMGGRSSDSLARGILGELPPEEQRAARLLQAILPPGSTLADSGGEIAVAALVAVAGTDGAISQEEAVAVLQRMGANSNAVQGAISRLSADSDSAVTYATLAGLAARYALPYLLRGTRAAPVLNRYQGLITTGAALLGGLAGAAGDPDVQRELSGSAPAGGGGSGGNLLGSGSDPDID